MNRSLLAASVVAGAALLIAPAGSRAQQSPPPAAASAAPATPATGAGAGALFTAANLLPADKPLPFTMRKVFHRLAHDKEESYAFTEARTFAISKNPVRQTGTLRSGKELGISLAYDGAHPHVIIVDDKGLIERQPGGHERSVTVAEHPELAALTDLYLNLLRGNAEKLFDYADVYFVGTAQAWELGLAPHDAAVAKRAGRVVISGGGRDVMRLENELPNGESRLLELGKVDRNPHYTPDELKLYFRGP